MRPDLPWNVAGIPPEAREAARAAARREGLSVGEWLTRRILRSFSDAAGDEFDMPRDMSSRDLGRDTWRGGYHDEPPPPPRRDTRDTDEMLARVSRSEVDSNAAYKRIEEQMRAVARRLESTERSQSENNRAMSKAAAEINVATREQAQAFDQLGSSVNSLVERIERVERSAASDGLKDAVKGLHQGLSRLADQIAQTANQSATQISALADNLESVAGKVGDTRNEAEALSHALEARIAQFDERVLAVEKLTQANAASVERALAANAAITRLEENVSKLESRGSDPAIDRRLSGIERALSDIAGRMEASERTPPQNPAVEENLKSLQQRIEAAEKRHRDAVAELRDAVTTASTRLAAVETTPHPVTGGGAAFATAPQPAYTPAPQSSFTPPPVQQSFDAPPFPDNVPLPQAVPPMPAMQDAFLPPNPQPAYDSITGAAVDPFAAPPPPMAGDPFTAQAAMGPQPGESFLAAARRSAQAAAAQAEADRAARGFGGFSWGSAQARPAAAATQTRSRYGLIGVLALLIVLAIVAGIMLNQRLSGPSTHSSGLSALFGNKPATATTAAPATDQSSASALSQPVAPATRNAPSSPALPGLKPQTVRSIAVHRVPAASARATATPAPSPASMQAPATTAPAAAPPRQQTASVAPLDRVTALANSGNAKAETIVGLKYLDGNGVPENDSEAAKWLDKAAQQGQPVAEYRLGTLYERGRGVPADQAKAMKLYLAAAQAGNRKAMHNLAVAYAQGTGAAKDYAEAARWFSKAAALGLADSQFNLAVLYERGLGVPQSLLDAYKWYAIAAAQGDTESKSRIDALTAQLSADDRAAAQRSADMFRPQPLDQSANMPPEMAGVGG
jgi:localization factor PodJL